MYRNPAPFPRNDSNFEWLRYIVQSCPLGAPEFQFMVGLLNYCLEHDGNLTYKQVKALAPYMDAAYNYVHATQPDFEIKDREYGDNVIPFKHKDK